ncbi:putative N-acetylmuramoyl-L-alanine amidase [Butyrivibrio sp. CAG:318]|nr:putative N-acetylmuramoyl-L-alanine amidase [Butyrivibrio sp. CAG:318]
MRRKLKVLFISTIIIIAIIGIIVAAEKILEKNDTGIKEIIDNIAQKEETTTEDPFLFSDEVIKNYLTPNEYSRPGKELKEVNAIVVHYVGNPGTTAAQNRSYFENLKDTHATSASSHYIIGMEGEIIQCVPLNEISYASNNRNKDTIAIECCHPDETGQFTTATYKSLVKLVAALCRTYDLDPETGIIRHYDVTGKYCPLYYVNHEDEWYGFKLDVKAELAAVNTK